MSRNIKTACREVFHILAEAAPVDPALIPAGDRFIAGGQQDSDCLAHAVRVASIQFSPSIIASRWTYNQRSYFAITGLKGISPSGVTAVGPESNNAGFKTALISERGIPLKDGITSSQMLEHVYGSSDSDTGYIGHDIDIIVELFFHEVTIFEILPTSLTEDLSWHTFNILVDSPELASLPFSQGVIGKSRMLRDQCSDAVNYESLVEMLLGASWRHAFMDAYRCVEYYYPLVITKDLYDEINFGGDLEALWAAIESKFGWRPKEELQLIRIVQYYSEINSRNSLTSELGCTSLETLAKHIYTQRNRIVHYRAKGLPRPDLTPLRWNKYIEFLLGCVYTLPTLINGRGTPQTSVSSSQAGAL